jgi:hypothetical protein
VRYIIIFPELFSDGESDNESIPEWSKEDDDDSGSESRPDSFGCHPYTCDFTFDENEKLLKSRLQLSEDSLLLTYY